MDEKVKQVLVFRRHYPDGDEGKVKTIRTGKIVAQACHASICWITSKMRGEGKGGKRTINLTEEEQQWIDTGFAKITVYVNTEEELLKVMEDAKAAGLTTHLITDAGTTEFGGTPTKTFLGIGPHKASKFDKVTSHLPLL